MVMYTTVFKRLLDFIISLMTLFICLPFALIIYILLKLDSPGPFFFFQERLGYRGRIFKVFKLRTMTHKSRIVHQEVLNNNPDVTKLGKIMRRLKIDELPQVINVLLGDMSLIGPRPGLPSQLEEYSEDGKKRLDVRPGLTGLAQVNGNIFMTWPERWVYDRYYVENLSLHLDIKILLKTFAILLKGEDKFLKSPQKND